MVGALVVAADDTGVEAFDAPEDAGDTETDHETQLQSNVKSDSPQQYAGMVLTYYPGHPAQFGCQSRLSHRYDL